MDTTLTIAKHAAAVTVVTGVDLQADGTCNGAFAMLVPSRDATTREYTEVGKVLAAEWRADGIEQASLFITGPGALLPERDGDTRRSCQVEIRHDDELVARIRPGTELHGTFTIHGTSPVMKRGPVAEGQTEGALIPAEWDDGTPKLRVDLVAVDVQIVRTGAPASPASAFSVDRG